MLPWYEVPRFRVKTKRLPLKLRQANEIELEYGDFMIELKNISHCYPNGTQALKNVTLNITAEKFTALIGSSGAGKSTLMRILNGLVKPTEGQVSIDGLKLTNAKAHEVREVRKHIGMVFQQFNLVKRLSALENVLTGRLGYMPTWRSSLKVYTKADRELAMHMLERVGLAEFAWQRADTLSGGQQQRVGIARALAQQPKLILADEPISALDPKSAAQVMDLLRSINEDDGIAVIANLHFLDTVRDYAGRVIGLRGGELVFDGTAFELDQEATQRIYSQEDLFDALNSPVMAETAGVHAAA